MHVTTRVAAASEHVSTSARAERPRARSYVARIASDDATRRQAWALRHESYLASGHIAMRPDGLFRDKYDEEETARTILVLEDTTPVASVRVCFLGRALASRAPAADTYPDEVASLLAAAPVSRSGHEIVEVTRLVRSPDAANNQGLVFILYRLAGYIALSLDFQIVLSCVRANHVPFYRRLRFREASPLRAYPGLLCPMQLLSAPRQDYDAARSALPVMDPSAFDPASFEGFLEGAPIVVPLLPETRA